MATSWQAYKERALDKLWKTDTRQLPRAKRWLYAATRASYAVGRDLALGRMSLEAASLVYTTLLSIVPLLALSFSVLKAMGVHQQLEPLIFDFFDPMGPRGVELGNRIMGFVDNVEARVLGSVGLVLLLYTVVSLVQKIETAFNTIWHVSQLRPMVERFSRYLTVILIGPVLVVAAMGMTASVLNSALMQQLAAIEPFGTLINAASRLVPYVLITAAFTFIYMFVPNTRVQLKAAFGGALIGGLLWQSTGFLFAVFMVSSTKYTAIYSGFAIVILVLIWVNLSWLILLTGANISFYLQNPAYMWITRAQAALTHRDEERVALSVMAWIGHRHYRGEPPPDAGWLATRLNLAELALVPVLERLYEQGVIEQARGGYLPAQAPEALALTRILAAVRAPDDHGYISARAMAPVPGVARLMAGLDEAIEQPLKGATLKTLVEASERETAPADNELRSQAQSG